MSPVGKTARAFAQHFFATCHTNDAGEIALADDAIDGCLGAVAIHPDLQTIAQWTTLGRERLRVATVGPASVDWCQPSGPHSTLFSMSGDGIRRIRSPSAVKIAMSEGPLPKSSEAEKYRPSGEKHG